MSIYSNILLKGPSGPEITWQGMQVVSLVTFATFASASVIYIGPDNLHERWSKLAKQKSIHGQEAVMVALETNYQVTPIKVLLPTRLSDEQTFEVLVKRDLALNHPDNNQFGLLRCEDLMFNPTSDSVDLGNGHQVVVQRFSCKADYEKAAEDAKQLQTQRLIKSLEKSSNTQLCTKIPFCFSDARQELWYAQS